MKQINMKNLKKLLILVFCLSLFGICANAFAGRSKDVSGYYILSTMPPDSYVGWTNTTSGTCPGITFPSTITPGLIPDPANEIVINPQSVAAPYNCTTIYTSSDTVGPMAGECLVTVSLRVINGAITKVNLGAIHLGGAQGCRTYPNSSVIFLGSDLP